MTKWYGNIDSRIEEGRNFNPDKLIHEGDDINVYYWSDVHCKYVDKVVDQKHIFVRDYQVCADHEKEGGMGHQNWKYFKTIKEHNEYLNRFFPEHNYDLNPKENEPEEWVFRYNHWNKAVRFTQKTIDEIKAREGWCRLAAKNEKEQALLDAGKEVVHYYPLDEKVSFGKDIRSYYYDWCF